MWEESQQEVRLETPFSSREARSNPQFQILQTTPPPSPRRSVPLPQFMGQISPCKQSTVVRNQRKLLTDLDITPAVTPIKVCYVYMSALSLSPYVMYVHTYITLLGQHVLYNVLCEPSYHALMGRAARRSK